MFSLQPYLKHDGSACRQVQGSDHAPAWVDLSLPGGSVPTDQAPPPLASRYLFGAWPRGHALDPLLLRPAPAKDPLSRNRAYYLWLSMM